MKKQVTRNLTVALLAVAIIILVFLVLIYFFPELGLSPTNREFYRVFVTSQTFDGKFGGVEGADAKCLAAANSAGLGGNWKAYVGKTGVTPESRIFQSTVPYKRLDGVTIANNYNDLIDRSITAQIDVNEFGQKLVLPKYSPSWTGSTGSDGKITNCKDWTSNNLVYLNGKWILPTLWKDYGGAGIVNWKDSGRSGAAWFSGVSSGCHAKNRLYCVEQPMCGNGYCDVGEEDCSSCAGDCGACAPVCGDGICSGDETCSECSQDCGVCITIGECGKGHTKNADGSCTARIATVLEDGYIAYDKNSHYYERNNQLSDIYVGQITAAIFRGYIEWDISSIPDRASILETSLVYSGSNTLNSNSGIGALGIRPSKTISSSEDHKKIYDSVEQGVALSFSEGQFPISGDNQKITFGENERFNLQIQLFDNWYTIGFMDKEESTIREQPATIKSNEYSITTSRPILEVNYLPPLHFCGDGYCENEETCSNCAGDCDICEPECGNRICGAGETCSDDCVFEMHCFDGIDNDGDGLVDFSDSSDCKYGAAAGEYCTLQIFGNAKDGYVSMNGESWFSAIMGNLNYNVVSNTNDLIAGAESTSGGYKITRGTVQFDTRSIPDDAEIVDASVFMYVQPDGVKLEDDDEQAYLALVKQGGSCYTDFNMGSMTAKCYSSTNEVVSEKMFLSDIGQGAWLEFPITVKDVTAIRKWDVGNVGTLFGVREGHDLDTISEQEQYPIDSSSYKSNTVKFYSAEAGADSLARLTVKYTSDKLKTESECTNRFDDDCDGLIDVADPDCKCGNGVCSYGEKCATDCTKETWCWDRVDNDGDGNKDASDYADCSCGDGRCDFLETCEGDCTTEKYCGDLADNDMDGRIDGADDDCGCPTQRLRNLQCSLLKPYLCSAGKYFESCTACGCPEGEICTQSGICVQACTPNCDGKQCGSDGCGGSCGECSEDKICDYHFGQCVDKECSDEDGGANIYQRGFTLDSSFPYFLRDSCVGDYLVEYYCDENEELNVKPILCRYGCILGKCNQCETDSNCIQGACQGNVCWDTCVDGTLKSTCASDKPYYCGADRIRREDCGKCGCPENMYCHSNSGVCLPESETCVAIVKNGNSVDKVDILFVADDYDNINEFKQNVEGIIDYNEQCPPTYKFYNFGEISYQPGFFSRTPIKENKQKFNVWIIPKSYSLNMKDYWFIPGTMKNFVPGQINEFRKICPQAELVAVLSKKDFRAHASLILSNLYLSVCPYGDNCDTFGCKLAGTFTHEFGHAFGKLADEYTEEGMGRRPWYPNCAPNMAIAKLWWGDLVGQGEGQTYVGYYNGCSYVEDNIRSTENSIMRYHNAGDDFGPVNERQLLSRLAEYS